jgi:hypothetical protein
MEPINSINLIFKLYKTSIVKFLSNKKLITSISSVMFIFILLSCHTVSAQEIPFEPGGPGPGPVIWSIGKYVGIGVLTEAGKLFLDKIVSAFGSPSNPPTLSKTPTPQNPTPQKQVVPREVFKDLPLLLKSNPQFQQNPLSPNPQFQQNPLSPNPQFQQNPLSPIHKKIQPHTFVSPIHKKIQPHHFNIHQSNTNR